MGATGPIAIKNQDNVFHTHKFYDSLHLTLFSSNTHVVQKSPLKISEQKVNIPECRQNHTTVEAK